MSENNETIADIAAQMRNGTIPRHRTDHELLALYADRIEAAWKREELRWANANGELARMIDLEKAQGGNAAAMREALEAIRDEAYERIIDGLATDANWLYKTAKAALAKPPRNCDILEWREAWDKWRSEKHPQKPTTYKEAYDGTEAFMDWYVGSSKQEGGEA